MGVLAFEIEGEETGRKNDRNKLELIRIASISHSNYKYT